MSTSSRRRADSNRCLLAERVVRVRAPQRRDDARHVPAVRSVTLDLYESVFAWGNNPRRAELKGRRCRVVARGSRMRSVLLEFENGERVVTSARAVRAA